MLAKMFAESDEELLAEFSGHARSKVLDLAKATGAIVTLSDYDFDLAAESLHTEKLGKAFNQVRNEREQNKFSISHLLFTINLFIVGFEKRDRHAPENVDEKGARFEEH